MRRLVLYMITTMDGFIAGRDGELGDWFPWDDEMKPFVNDIFRNTDTIVYGRVTYETIVPYWEAIAAGNQPPDVPVTDGDVEYASAIGSFRSLRGPRSRRARQRPVRAGTSAR